MKVIDCTLREGFQFSDFNFQEDALESFVQKLALTGISMIECSHPLISASYANLLKSVVALNLSVPVLTHCRANIEDIDAAIACGATWIGIFIGVNDISLSSKYNGRTLEDIEELLVNSLQYAKQKNLKIRLTIEDASRTPMELLLKYYKLAIKNGADRICFADTVGILTPAETISIIPVLKKHFQNTPLEVHFHNDRGFALANSFIAAESGAEWVSSSVLGIGERSGICDTFQLLANKAVKHKTTFNHKTINEVEQLVSAFSRIPLNVTRPFFGAKAFTHTSKLHKTAMKRNAVSYSSIDPTQFGKQAQYGTNNSFKNFSIANFTSTPFVRSAAELKFHTKGPGNRYVLLNNELLPEINQYMILREIEYCNKPKPHVDHHIHDVDSFYVFLGREKGFTGLEVEVFMGDHKQALQSPVTVFIPAGLKHKYEIIRGGGYYINHVSKGNYNQSIIEYAEFEVKSMG